MRPAPVARRLTVYDPPPAGRPPAPPSSADHPRTIPRPVGDDLRRVRPRPAGHVRCPADLCRTHNPPPPRTNAWTRGRPSPIAARCRVCSCHPSSPGSALPAAHLRAIPGPLADASSGQLVLAAPPPCPHHRTIPLIPGDTSGGPPSSPLSATSADRRRAILNPPADTPTSLLVALGPVQSRPRLSRRHDQHFTNPRKSAFSRNPDQLETPHAQGAGRGSAGAPQEHG